MPRSSSGVLGPSVGLQFPLLSGNWKTSRLRGYGSGFLPPTSGRSFIGGTSVWSSPLLQVTAVSLAFGLATAVFCCGDGFTRGYGCRLSSSPSGVSDGDISVPLMLCASTGIFSGQSWPLLDFPCCGFSAGLCRSCLASQLPLSLCCFTPLPGLVLLKPSLSGVLTVFSAPDSERRTALGCSSCSVSFFCRLVSFYPSGWLERRLGSLPPIFSPFLFLGSLRYSEVNGCGAGMGLPYRVVPFFSYGVALPPQ